VTGELFNEPLPDDLLDHLEDPEVRARWPQGLVDMLDVVTEVIVRQGQPREQAARLSACVVRALAHYFGGRMTYIPRGDSLDRALRDKAIWDAHDGRRTSVQELAVQHRLTEQQVYAILREQRALHRRRIQPQLDF